MFYVVNKDQNRICGLVGVASEIPDTLKSLYDVVPVQDFLNDCSTDEDRLNKIFENAGRSFIKYFDDDKFVVEIDFGDWKHDHLFCDQLLKSVGYDLVSENITEECGADCYSAIRTYDKSIFSSADAY